MKWKNAVTDCCPADKDLVLISVSGVYYLAVYYESDRMFKVHEHQEHLKFYVDKQTIYWTEFNNSSG